MCQNRRKTSSSDLEEKVIGVIHHEYGATMSLIPSDFAYNPFPSESLLIRSLSSLGVLQF
jgi:hypothetical protein